MQSVSQAVLLSWSVPPAATFALALTAVIYLRGWVLMRRAGVPFIPPWRAFSFLLGLSSLWIALASPVDTFDGFLLTAHMLQHMMLMMVAPPLILLGAPVVPMVRGLPVFAAREFAGPLLNWRVACRVGNALTRPVVALLLMGGVMFAWHTPRLYELALASNSWHQVEHACFFLVSLIFWWPVVQPWPGRSHWPRWAMVPYLLIADLQNTTLSAILVFSDKVIYPSYEKVPRLFGLSAQHDQSAAGAMMWVLGSLPFTIPAVVIAIQCLQAGRPIPSPSRGAESAPLDAMVSLSQKLSFAGRILRRRLSAGSVEAVSFLVLFAASGLLLAHLASGSSDDDDLVQRLHETSGPFTVTVFAPAGELDAGLSDFNVLVQDPGTQQTLIDAKVQIHAHQTNTSAASESVLTTTDSENRLLQTASLDLPAAGEWILGITVAQGTQRAEFSLPVSVAKTESGFSIPWSYVVLLVISVVLLLTYIRRHAIARREVGENSVAERGRAATLP